MRAAACAVAGALAVSLVAAVPASAREATKSERLALLRAIAKSPQGRDHQVTVTRTGATSFTPVSYRTRARVTASRSSVNGGWATVELRSATRYDQALTFMMRRTASGWRTHWAARVGVDAENALCRSATPGTLISLDLGYDVTGVRPCRYPRNRLKLVRPMNAAELGSVRSMVEWTWQTQETPDGTTSGFFPGPTQPAWVEPSVSTVSCEWDGNPRTGEPLTGEVSVNDPRWGVVKVLCRTGSDGFSDLYSPTMILVQRAGRTGAFTVPHGHAREYRSDATGRRWAIPAASRAALRWAWPYR